jgi:ubiquinone/menaquinone biosynthesis C-methylase UbiE
LRQLCQTACRLQALDTRTSKNLLSASPGACSPGFTLNVWMRDEYLATGFADVDSAENTASYSDCLSLLDSLPYFREYKRKTYELLELGPFERVLDAGCGLGDDVFRMAELIIPSGLVVGLDSSAKLIEKAKSDERGRAFPVEFHVGDLRHLPFAEKTFTRCRIDRVLQHVPQPNVAISELIRVLKPQGILVAYDNDWGTFSVTSQAKLVTRILENAWCDSFANSWIGRELCGYFMEVGLSNVTVHPSVSLIADFDTADKVYNLRQTVQRAIAAGHISTGQGSAWVTELQARARAGSFAVALTAYTVVGRKPA